MRMLAVLILLLGLASGVRASEGGEHGCGMVKCDPVKVDLHNQESLQRGARTFVNYCLSCHSAGYMRYNRVGRDLGIPEDLVKEDLVFTSAKVGDLMKVAMRSEDAKEWFKSAPPDLTLVTRSRSPEWVYTYLRSFYRDDKTATGWNNAVFPNVAMPHVLYEAQGEQRWADGKLQLTNAGTRKPEEFDRDMRDLTNFLAYLGEPAKLDRYSVGFYVLIFLAVFFVVAYLLKKEYWKDVH